MTDEDHDIPNSSVFPVPMNDEPGPSDRVLPNESFDDNAEHANSSTDEASDGDDFVGGHSRASIASAIMNSRRQLSALTGISQYLVHKINKFNINS